MRKVCVVTGSRAEYGLLFWLIKYIQEDEELELQLLVTGMHLSTQYGLTYKEIEKDFKIDRKIDIDLSDNSAIGISKSMGIAHSEFAKAYDELKPDLLVVLGDRYEIFCAASVATIFKIPIAHIHGGESTEGAFDEVFRHSITKMSHLHFSAAKEYRDRVIQLGEQPERVYNVGGLGVDSIKKLKLLNRDEFEKSIDFRLKKKNLLITFHPVTLENSTAKKQFEELLYAVDLLSDTNLIFTKANSDTDGMVINSMIDSYVESHKDKSISFASLGQLRYLSALQHVDAIVGNSSSGLLEAPSLKTATINIGDRQKGRIKALSVIDCKSDSDSILKAIQKLYSDEFKKSLKNLKNPYGEGGASKKILDVIKKTDLDDLLKKKFYDFSYDIVERGKDA